MRRVIVCDLAFYSELLSLLLPEERWTTDAHHGIDGLILKTATDNELVFVPKRSKDADV
jgi:hypothetical protein